MKVTITHENNLNNHNVIADCNSGWKISRALGLSRLSLKHRVI